MRSKKMEEYRKILQKTLEGSKCRMKEINDEMQIAISEFKKKSDGLVESERYKLLKECCGSLPEEKRKLSDLISRLEIEVLDKKFANKVLFSDVEPFEVIEEKTPKLYIIRSMKSEQTSESKRLMSDSFVKGGFVGTYDNYLQDWNISSDLNGEVLKIRRHKNGKFYDSNGIRYSISAQPCNFTISISKIFLMKSYLIIK